MTHFVWRETYCCFETSGRKILTMKLLYYLFANLHIVSGIMVIQTRNLKVSQCVYICVRHRMQWKSHHHGRSRQNHRTLDIITGDTDAFQTSLRANEMRSSKHVIAGNSCFWLPDVLFRQLAQHAKLVPTATVWVTLSGNCNTFCAPTIIGCIGYCYRP